MEVRRSISFPIEIKATSQPKNTHVSGIKAFRSTYPKLNIAPGLVIGSGAQFFALSENDYAMPWNVEF
jgi:hypothetical protein